MKKFAITTILAAITMASQAQVSLSGKVSEWADQTKTGSKSVTSLVTEPTSNVAINAAESVGPGLKIRATVETSLSGNTYGGSETRLGDRQSTVRATLGGLSLDLGRQLHPQFVAITSNDAFDTLIGSVAGDVHNFRGLRTNGATVSYSMGPALTVAANRGMTGAASEANAYSLSTSFKAPVLSAVNATVAHYSLASDSSTVFGLNATLAGARVFYTHSDDKTKVGAKTVETKGNLVGATKEFGAITAKASYGKNGSTTAYALGADYNLSKRTAAGLVFRNVDAAGTANDVKQFALGLTHKF
jgi:hypothetical protein